MSSGVLGDPKRFGYSETFYLDFLLFTLKWNRLLKILFSFERSIFFPLLPVILSIPHTVLIACNCKSDSLQSISPLREGILDSVVLFVISSSLLVLSI